MYKPDQDWEGIGLNAHEMNKCLIEYPEKLFNFDKVCCGV
jgi:hypothetical protein